MTSSLFPLANKHGRVFVLGKSLGEAGVEEVLHGRVEVRENSAQGVSRVGVELKGEHVRTGKSTVIVVHVHVCT